MSLEPGLLDTRDLPCSSVSYPSPESSLLDTQRLLEDAIGIPVATLCQHSPDLGRLGRQGSQNLRVSAEQDSHPPQGLARKQTRKRQLASRQLAPFPSPLTHSLIHPPPPSTLPKHTNKTESPHQPSSHPSRSVTRSYPHPAMSSPPPGLPPPRPAQPQPQGWQKQLRRTKPESNAALTRPPPASTPPPAVTRPDQRSINKTTTTITTLIVSLALHHQKSRASRG